MTEETALKAQALKEKRSLPLEAKIVLTQQRIKEWYDYWGGQVYVAFSGGKDSTVLKHIVENTPEVHNVPNVFVNTGLEYPEIKEFVKRQQEQTKNVEIVRARWRFDEVIEDYGYPVISKEIAERIRYAREGKDWAIKAFDGLDANGEYCELKQRSRKYKYLIDAPFKISGQCCAKLKKEPSREYEKKTGRKPILGTLAEESFLRLAAYYKTGCNGFKGPYPKSQPLSFWTNQDILEYIVKYNVPYAKVYGEIRKNREGRWFTTGASRTGCMFCMFAVQNEGYPNRFQQMQTTHPKQWEYCLKDREEGGLGLAKVLDYIGVKYEDRN